MDQLPRLGKRELICLLLFTCNYVVFVWRGFLFLWVLGLGYVILLWHSLSLPYNYFEKKCVNEQPYKTSDDAANNTNEEISSRITENEIRLTIKKTTTKNKTIKHQV